MCRTTLPCDVSKLPSLLGGPDLQGFLPRGSARAGIAPKLASLLTLTNSCTRSGDLGGHGLGSSQGCVSSVLRCFQFLDIPCTNLDVLLPRSQKLWNPSL